MIRKFDEFMKVRRASDPPRKEGEGLPDRFYFHYLRLEGIQENFGLYCDDGQAARLTTEIHVQGFTDPVDVLECPQEIMDMWATCRQKHREALAESVEKRIPLQNGLELM